MRSYLWRNVRASMFKVFCVCLFVLFVSGHTVFGVPEDAAGKDTGYIEWLEQQSMLYNSGIVSGLVSGQGIQWRNPYAEPQTEALVAATSVWFVAYPSSIITGAGESILTELANENLWAIFEDMGIQAMHTGPLKKAGGISGYEYTPTVDGWFDRIELTIDPAFGSDEEYKDLVRTADEFNAVIVGDIIPGHTGKGADFRLAEMGYKDYPGIYTMVNIDEADWGLLPEVPEDEDSANLPVETVNILKDKGYIPGQLERVLFSVPGQTHVTGWDATKKVTGADGTERRWVYLHYFRPGQPTLNWLDPTFAANRLVSGDILKTRLVFGSKIIRLDANPFLGIEMKPDSETTWSEAHPLAIDVTDNIAFLTRKLGGWSFQELNMSLDDIKKFMRYGPELSYDFITRPAYNHALLTGDAGFLKLTMRLMEQYGIKPVKLIHALQNHDEITYELVHFTKHPDEMFSHNGKEYTGKAYREKIINEMHSAAVGKNAAYNKLSGNGLCTTYAGFCAAAFGIKDPYTMSLKEVELVKKGHFLMAVFNAMQPGVFALSGWDLVGALPLPAKTISKLVSDGDYRWVNRGAYDLMGADPKANVSSGGMPKAKMLYGTLPEQLKDPGSFASKIKAMLKVREEYNIALSEQIEVPEVKDKGLVVMAHQLPQDKGIEITLLNFGREKIRETVEFRKINNMMLMDAFDQDFTYQISDSGEMTIELDALESKILVSNSIQ